MLPYPPGGIVSPLDTPEEVVVVEVPVVIVQLERKLPEPVEADSRHY